MFFINIIPRRSVRPWERVKIDIQTRIKVKEKYRNLSSRMDIKTKMNP